MTAQNFPFAFPLTFDAEKLTELFSAARLPGVDSDAVLAAQQKNVEALIEANQVVIAGYQDLFKRQVALFEAAVAETKDKLAQAQGQPLTADQASQNVEALKAAFEKAATDFKELAELAQKANTGAFEIVKARAEEAVAEFKAAAEKTAA
jgi:phasin family protein